MSVLRSPIAEDWKDTVISAAPLSIIPGEKIGSEVNFFVDFFFSTLDRDQLVNQDVKSWVIM